MNTKNTVFEKDFDAKIFSGVEKLYRVVSKTFGPNGRTIVLKQPGQLPIVTKDGYTVAKFFDTPDDVEKIGVDFVRNSSKKTATVAGDGSTSTVILAYNLLKSCFQMKVEDGVHPVEIAKKLDEFTKDVKNRIVKYVKNVETTADIFNVAKISTNGDLELSEIITEAVERVGVDGMIQLRETQNAKSYIEVMDGFRLPAGLASSKLIPMGASSLVLENCSVLVYNDTLAHSSTLMNVLKTLTALPNNVLIFAHDFDEKSLSTILMLSSGEKYKNKFIPIQVNAYGKDRSDALEDLSIFCGSRQFGKAINTPFSDDFNLKDLGFCSKIEVSKNRCLVINGGSNAQDIELRISQLSAEIADCTDETETLKLNNRVSNLSSSAVYLYVGGNNELDRVERKHRAEDAISACASAIKSGIIPGGGATLVCLASENSPTLFGNALLAPFEILCRNANISPESYNLKNGEVVDLKTGDVVNAFEEGIIDVHMCLINAVENAASVVKMLILSDACIYEVEKELK